MIQRNLQGKCEEDVRRTIEDLNAQIESLNGALTKLQSSSNGNALLNSRQLAQVAGLIGARSQAVIGFDVADPMLPGSLAGGTVTSFSAGDLAPLFTTNEVTVTTTPALTFNQIVQNPNLIYAGPASGIAANPTFRALTAADFQTIGATLLQSTVFDLNVGTKQTLYTVPAGKSAIPLWMVLRSPSVDLSGGATTRITFGFDAGATDFGAQFFDPTILTAPGKYAVFSQEDAAPGAVSVIGAAAQTFGAIVDAPFGSGATMTIDLYGGLF